MELNCQLPSFVIQFIFLNFSQDYGGGVGGCEEGNKEEKGKQVRYKAATCLLVTIG